MNLMSHGILIANRNERLHPALRVGVPICSNSRVLLPMDKPAMALRLRPLKKRYQVVSRSFYKNYSQHQQDAVCAASCAHHSDRSEDGFIHDTRVQTCHLTLSEGKAAAAAAVCTDENKRGHSARSVPSS